MIGDLNNQGTPPGSLNLFTIPSGSSPSPLSRAPSQAAPEFSLLSIGLTNTNTERIRNSGRHQSYLCRLNFQNFNLLYGKFGILRYLLSRHSISKHLLCYLYSSIEITFSTTFFFDILELVLQVSFCCHIL